MFKQYTGKVHSAEFRPVIDSPTMGRKRSRDRDMPARVYRHGIEILPVARLSASFPQRDRDSSPACRADPSGSDLCRVFYFLTHTREMISAIFSRPRDEK